MKKIFFSSGEFASLCNTTKETLRHYHRISLLEPEKTESNGYQYYSDLQVYDFYLIDTLKSTGCSLEKIREFFLTPTQNEIQSILEKQLQLLLVDKKNLLRKENLLRRSIEKFELLRNPSIIGQFTLEFCEAEYFIATPIDSCFYSTKAFLKAQKDHVQYCREHDLGDEFQFSFLLLYDCFIKKDYYSGNAICSRIRSATDNVRLHVKPEGNYLKLIKPWNPDIEGTYHAILKHAHENNLEISGNLYESEISHYTSSDGSNYITEISVLVT